MAFFIIPESQSEEIASAVGDEAENKVLENAAENYTRFFSACTLINKQADHSGNFVGNHIHKMSRVIHNLRCKNQD